MTCIHKGFLFALAATMLTSHARAELYVVQLGAPDGSGPALSGVSTAVAIQKFSNAGGSPLSTINLPIAVDGANQPFTTSGSATSEGFLTLSANGTHLTMAGYAIAPDTTAIAGTNSTTAPRAVARIDVSNDSVNTTTAFVGPADTTFSGGNPRSAVSSNGTDLWLSGSIQGIRTSTIGASASTVVSSTVTNTRVANIFNGQLYVSSGSGSFIGVNAVGTGLPTGSGETTTNVVLTTGTGTGTASPYDFWFKDANTLYIADDRTAANGGGIQKWAFDTGASTWSLSYTLGVGAGARGLAGTIDESNNAVLYATTAEASANRLVSIVDTDASATFSLLSQAAANSAYRGVELVSGVINPPTNNSDFDNDGDVDGADFLTWQANLGATGVPIGNKSTGDANGDGNVDAADLGIWQAHFGLPPSVGAAGAVPEPGTLALAGLCLAAAGVARRRA